MKKPPLLIYALGNSCRSQMAEAIINHLAAPNGKHQRGERSLPDMSIPWRSGTRGKSASATAGIPNQSIAFVGRIRCGNYVFVADERRKPAGQARERKRRVHIGIPDPAKAEGSEDEKMEVFASPWTTFKSRILAYLKAFQPANRSRQDK